MTLRIEQTPPRPQRPRPIVLIGAGGIVHDAHLPAYRKAGFPVHGITDLQREKAETLARAFAIPNIYATTEEAVQNAPPEAVYDIAVPASALLSVLEKLPPGAAALMQKPMGENLEQARAAGALCRERKLPAPADFPVRLPLCLLAARGLTPAG